MWHVAPESKIQLVNFELSPKFPLGHSSLLDMRDIYAYIFWSPIFSLLSRARLKFPLKRTCFPRFSLSFGGCGYFSIRLSSDLHINYFPYVCSVRLLSKAPAARAFSFSCLILLKLFLQSDYYLHKRCTLYETCFLYHYFFQNMSCYQDLDNHPYRLII